MIKNFVKKIIKQNEVQKGFQLGLVFHVQLGEEVFKYWLGEGSMWLVFIVHCSTTTTTWEKDGYGKEKDWKNWEQESWDCHPRTTEISINIHRKSDISTDFSRQWWYFMTTVKSRWHYRHIFLPPFVGTDAHRYPIFAPKCRGYCQVFFHGLYEIPIIQLQ